MPVFQGEGDRKDGRSPVSTRSEESISQVDITEITDFDDFQSLSTSAVLFRCKNKILKPYMRLLAVMGLRGFGTDSPDISEAAIIFSYLHLLCVTFFTVLGYVLQFMACLRRDRGFYCKTDDTIDKSYYFVFILPSALHFGAYVYVLHLFRYKETEKLENLMERTFLLSAHRTDGPRKAHLVTSLWIFICTGIIWLITSFSLMIVLLLRSDSDFNWLHTDNKKISFKIILVLSTLWQDMIQVTIITSYCLQTQLLSSSLHFLRAKLLQHTINPLSWIREINECQNFLNYLNEDFSPGVCIFIFVNASWMISDVLWFVKDKSLKDEITVVTSAVYGILWFAAAIVPFIMAASLTSACTMLRHLGHEVRIRPFVYQDTPGEDLDTILLYTSTLKLKAKLFGVPIVGRYFLFCITLLSLSVLVIGQTQLF